MNKTKIEWVKNPDGSQGYTWNPITGCLNHVNGMCKGGGFPCYAYRLANGRLRERYLANKNTATKNYDEDSYPFYPRFWEERLEQINAKQKPRGVFTCDMSDLFGKGIPEKWTWGIINLMTYCSQHRFYLLTKQPQNLIKWSPFPDNCFVGVTATDADNAWGARVWLNRIEAKVKYISFEPLLNRINDDDTIIDIDACLVGVNWVIIGAMTCSGGDLAKLSSQFPELTPKPFGNRYALLPKTEWVQEIVEAADKAGVKVFLKNNLANLFTHQDRLFFGQDEDIPEMLKIRQEMPSV